MTSEDDQRSYLAIDMGAESSRAVVGRVTHDSLVLEELRRWPTRNETVEGTQYWDFPFLLGEIKQALRDFGTRFGSELEGIAIDSWGVDFGLLDDAGKLIENPVQYRDHRTDGLLDASRSVMPHETIYAKTGIAFLQFNSLYQLWALARTRPEMLESAKTFLMMPDLLHYHLCGVARCEYTNGSTSQLIDAHSRKWDAEIFDAFGLPLDIMPEIVPPGTVLGALDPAIAKEAGLNAPKIITPCTHDTASAVLAVPATTPDWAYISCGTWSLMGAELDGPLTTPEAWHHNFTNEGGYANTIRFLKNIMGLWVFQQARASWAKRGEDYTYEELVAMAKEASPFSAVLNIDDSIFFNPDDMLEAIQQHCRNTGQTPPKDVATTARAILEGLALRYAVTLRELETVTGRTFSTVHLVGGGTKNKFLCQLASDAMNRTVIAGPTEATALGNIVTQAIATGTLANHREGRKLIGRISDTETYEPINRHGWEPLREKFCNV